jgi:hypothetical protein
MPDVNAIGNNVQQFIGPYQTPAMVIGGIVFVVWVFLTYRALQAYNASDAAQLDQIMKHK